MRVQSHRSFNTWNHMKKKEKKSDFWGLKMASFNDKIYEKLIIISSVWA